jgi:hypothetical protein
MLDFISFWRRVLALSLGRSVRWIIPHTMPDFLRTALVALVPFVVAYFYGPWLVRRELMSADNVQDTLIWVLLGLAGLVAIWLLLFLVHVLFITPFTMWRDAGGKVPIKSAKKIKLTASERSAKILAIDKALDLLSNSGELNEARSDLQAAKNTWRQAAAEDRIDPYLSEVRALLDRFEKALQEVGRIQAVYGRLCCPKKHFR